MPDKLRAGIIGCGGMGRSHIEGYLNSGRFEVVALADLSAEAMEECDDRFDERSEYRPTHHTDAHEMLESEELDVVSVAVWHGGHAKWTIAAASRRPKAVLCEKPVAHDLGSAQEMLMVCRRNGVKLAIGHQRRFLPSYTLARELVEQGAIGDVQLISSVAGAGLPNTSSHEADMMRYVLGDDDCEWVMGGLERETDQYERATRIEDRAVGAFGFEGGARGLILSDLTPSHYQGGAIYGSEGMIDLRPTHLRLLNGDTGGAWRRMALDGKFFKADKEGFDVLEGMAAQAVELADWIDGKIEKHRGEATHGYKSAEMVVAIQESARLHRRVALPVHTSRPKSLK